MMTPGTILTGKLAIVSGIMNEFFIFALAFGLFTYLNDDFFEQNIYYYGGIVLISLVLSILVVYIIKKKDKYGKK